MRRILLRRLSVDDHGCSFGERATAIFRTSCVGDRQHLAREIQPMGRHDHPVRLRQATFVDPSRLRLDWWPCDANANPDADFTRGAVRLLISLSSSIDPVLCAGATGCSLPTLRRWPRNRGRGWPARGRRCQGRQHLQLGDSHRLADNNWQCIQHSPGHRRDHGTGTTSQTATGTRLGDERRNRIEYVNR